MSILDPSFSRHRSGKKRSMAGNTSIESEYSDARIANYLYATNKSLWQYFDLADEMRKYLYQTHINASSAARGLKRNSISQCYMYCLWEQFGLVDDKRELSLNGMLTFFQRIPAYRAEVEKAISECKGIGNYLGICCAFSFSFISSIDCVSSKPAIHSRLALASLFFDFESFSFMSS